MKLSTQQQYPDLYLILVSLAKLDPKYLKVLHWIHSEKNPDGKKGSHYLADNLVAFFPFPLNSAIVE